MTDREFAYKQLTENPIKSGQWTIIFDDQGNYSLGDFHILKNNVGKFGSNYLINSKDDKIFVRLYTISGQKKLTLETNKENKEIEFGPNFLESPIQDFLYLISNEQWVVEDVVPDK